MSEVFDVTLDGQGYMVKPGEYQRFQAGEDQGRVGRVRLLDFFGGARRTYQVERDRFYRGVGAWPTLDAQGITAGPKVTDFSEGALDVTDGVTARPMTPTNKRWSFAYDGETYVVEGSSLYKLASSSGSYAGYEHVQELAADVLDACFAVGRLHFAHGTGTRMSQYNLATGSYNASFGSAAIYTDLCGTNGLQVYYDNSFTSGFDQRINYVAGVSGTVNGSAIDLDSRVLQWAQVDGTLWLFTRRAIWRNTGLTDFTVEASLPRLGYEDDLAWAEMHFGKLFTWIGKEVVYYDTKDDIFLGTGLRGFGTVGACSVGTWLVVGVVNDVSGNVELWGWNGQGWWLLDEQTDSSDLLSWPVSVVGAADDADMLCGRGSTDDQTRVYQFFPRSGSLGGRSSYELVTALWDGGERDMLKVWRRAGAEFAVPDDRATADSVNVALSYSVDGGATWVTVASDTVSSATGRILSLGGAITALPSGNWLQLKLDVSDVSTWCPVLVGLWAEHETMDTPTRRRRWRFGVLCKDKVVKRDGSVDSTGGRALAERLWNAWDDGDVVTFKDIDYDRTAVTHNVRIVGIRETVQKPELGATLADGDLQLTLVEV